VNFLKNEGEIPEYIQGKYKRMNIIANEALSDLVKQHVRENAFKKERQT
jgi:hypothetical protein